MKAERPGGHPGAAEQRNAPQHLARPPGAGKLAADFAKLFHRAVMLGFAAGALSAAMAVWLALGWRLP
jgi:hypothetical protein